ncbi:MAG TPA: rRNA maturation RNase YbeY [Candidatus Paceibacterota bacterium]
MVKKSKIAIKQQTKGKLPSLPFQLLKNAVLGKNFDLSIIFATEKTSRTLNRRFRNKNRATNILSFPLSPTSGELVIHAPTIKIEAPRFGRSYKKFLGLLIIHGMLHLKGMQHSSKMESKEKSISTRFGFN